VAEHSRSEWADGVCSYYRPTINRLYEHAREIYSTGDKFSTSFEQLYPSLSDFNNFLLSILVSDARNIIEFAAINPMWNEHGSYHEQNS